MMLSISQSRVMFSQCWRGVKRQGRVKNPEPGWFFDGIIDPLNYQRRFAKHLGFSVVSVLNKNMRRSNDGVNL